MFVSIHQKSYKNNKELLHVTSVAGLHLLQEVQWLVGLEAINQTVVTKLSRTSNFIGSCWHQALLSIVTIVCI